MNRRSFLILASCSGWIKKAFVEIPPKPLWYPHPKQLEFLNDDSYRVLYGIPYHHTDASTGTWLGISRS